MLGAGIVGACIAYQLARRGAAVSLVDKGQPAAGVTREAFGWINVSHSILEPDLPLRHLAIPAYHRLECALDHTLQVNWCGALTWVRGCAQTESFVRECAARGHDVRLIERHEVAALEPNLIHPPIHAAYAADEGAVDPVPATQALIRAAQQAGADIRLNIGPVTLAVNDQKITGLRTNEYSMTADVVVLAAGNGAAALCKPLGIGLPIKTSPAILLRLKTTGPLVKAVISNPEMEIRQATASHAVAAENYIDRFTV